MSGQTVWRRDVRDVAVPLGLAFGEWCFGVLDVAVPLGFAFQGVTSKLCFRDKFQLKWRFWWERAQNGSKSFQTCDVVQILKVR